MIVHSFDPVVFDLGFFQIRWYSLAYIFGISLGWLYAIKLIKFIQKNNVTSDPIKTSQFDDLIVYIIIGIVLGGRIGYIVFYNFDYYSQNITEIFKIWQGGMSFHGGLIGVVIATFIFSSKKFFHFSDIICCATPIGIFFGRVANFINGELVGKVSTLPWAIIYPIYDNMPRHPSQIYEAINEGIILFILINFLALKKKLIFNAGYISGYFLIYYSILRIFSEIFREPDTHLGYFFNYLSLGSLLSFLTLIFGFIIIFLIKKNEKNN
jgi:phosphatidylglycerol---prolipoprotein diacylglyceryl transferase